MITIGLTGSIAMGKSEVANILRSEDIPVFDADGEVHRLYDSNEGAQLLQPIAPDTIIDGKVNRARLSKAVLRNPELLKKVEAVVHAEIAKQRLAFAAEANRMATPIIVVDVPLLFETGGEKQVDVTVVVSSPEDQQKTRALARPGMTPEKLEIILNRQMPDAEKRRLANYVIINDGTREELRKTTLAVLSNIKKEHRL
jgi:dephospho-CoA kinase